MQILMKETECVFNASLSIQDIFVKPLYIGPAEMELERIPSPTGIGFWFVMKGTLIGKPENSWREAASDRVLEIKETLEELGITVRIQREKARIVLWSSLTSLLHKNLDLLNIDEQMALSQICRRLDESTDIELEKLMSSGVKPGN